LILPQLGSFLKSLDFFRAEVIRISISSTGISILLGLRHNRADKVKILRIKGENRAFLLKHYKHSMFFWSFLRNHCRSVKSNFSYLISFLSPTDSFRAQNIFPEGCTCEWFGFVSAIEDR
jgi:hypothetical protein